MRRLVPAIKAGHCEARKARRGHLHQVWAHSPMEVASSRFALLAMTTLEKRALTAFVDGSSFYAGSFAMRALSSHRRRAAASSCAAALSRAGRHSAKYSPVTCATSGDDAR